MTNIIYLIKKNQRTVILIAIAVILLVVAIVFYTGYQAAADEKAKVEKSRATTIAQLGQAQEQYNLDKLRAKNDELKGSTTIASAFPNVEISAFLAGDADKYGVILDDIKWVGASGSEKLGNKSYTRYIANIAVAGSEDRVNSFLRYLEEGPLLSLKLEKVYSTTSGATFTLVWLAG